MISQSQADIVNRAVQLIGGYNNQGPVTGTPPTFDGTPIGLAAGVVYYDVVATVAREFKFDFSRKTAALAVPPGPAQTPPEPWQFMYMYPADGLQIRQVMPSSGLDPNDPQPVLWSVQNVIVESAPVKVILTNVGPAATVVYTNTPPEAIWDQLFTQAVERLLASVLSTAIAGRPATSERYLGESQNFSQAGSQRGDT
jgi:hypothetical protein